MTPPVPFRAVAAQRGTCLSITVVGELDLATVGQLPPLVARAGTSDLLIIDLTATTFMDSSGLQTLLRLGRRATEEGTRFVVVCDEGPVRRVFELCGVADRFDIVASHPRPSVRIAA